MTEPAGSPRDIADYPPQPAAVGLRGRCPRCGDGGLDFSFADSGDGPAVFVILIVGFFVAAGALFLEFNAQPPFWLHLVIWGPLTVVLSLVLLRAAKGLLIALQYRHRAGEGRPGQS